MVAPYYNEDGITIYNADCRDVLPQLEPVDLVLTDPPYGIRWKPRVNHQNQTWIDDRPFDPFPFLSIGKQHLFWGANYFCDKLPPTNSWLTWIKRPISFDFSMDRRSYATTECAWSDFKCGNRFIAHVWDGGLRAGNADNRSFCHPAQKPIEVMKWCLILADNPQIVFDPFMGSGTTLVAAKALGLKAIGIELERKYCDIAVKRLRQRSLFSVLPEMEVAA